MVEMILAPPMHPLVGIGITSQSGNVMLALIAEAKRRGGVGFSTYVGVGNQLDIWFKEYLENFGEDDNTKAAVFYVEGFQKGKRFLEVCREVTQKKPVVIYKSGRTEAGQSAASSHTGSPTIPNTRESTLAWENRIAILTLERDDVRNALTGTALIDDIVDTVEGANEVPEVAVLVITGAGAAFSAGGNVKEMRDRAGTFASSVPEVEDRHRRGIQRIPLALQAAEMPVIAVVNGAAISAGCDLACMCDIRIASIKALLGETFVISGLCQAMAARGSCDG